MKVGDVAYCNKNRFEGTITEIKDVKISSIDDFGMPIIKDLGYIILQNKQIICHTKRKNIKK